MLYSSKNINILMYHTITEKHAHCNQLLLLLDWTSIDNKMLCDRSKQAQQN